MSDENIEIEIADKISPSISKKLYQMAVDARDVHSAVAELQIALKSLSLTQPIVKLQTEMAKASLASQKLTTEINKSNAAYLNAETALNKAIASEQKSKAATDALALSKSKLATEEARTATATANAPAATDRAALAAPRLQTAQEKAARGGGALQREAEALRRSLDPLYAAEQAYNASLEKASRLFKQGAIDARTYLQAISQANSQVKAARAAAEAMSNGVTKVGNNAKLSRHHLVNLGYQIQDIGVSLASGQKPLTVFIQQGSQIAGIAAASGASFSQMGKAIGGLLLKFWPLAVAAAGLYGSFKLFQSVAEEGAGLKEYAKSLGATNKEIKKLNLDHITLGDTMKGLWATIKDQLNIGPIFDGLGSKIRSFALNAFKTIWDLALQMNASFDAIFGAVIPEIFKRFINFMKKEFTNYYNFYIDLFEKIVNKSIDGINIIIKGLNKINPGENIKLLDHVSFDRKEAEDVFSESGKSLSDIFMESFDKNLANYRDSSEKFVKAWLANTVKAAKDRIKKELEDKKDKTERYDPYLKVKNDLEQELALLQNINRENTVAVRLAKIKSDLLEQKRTLTPSEVSALESQLNAIRNQKTENELAKVNQEISKQTELFKYHGEALEVFNKMQELRIKNIQQDTAFTEEQYAAIEKLYAAQVRMNAVYGEEAALLSAGMGQRQKFIDQLTAMQNLNNNQGFSAGDRAGATNELLKGMGVDTTNFKSNLDSQIAALNTYNEQIEKMYNARLLTEQEYSSASLQIELQRQNLYLNSASGFFGNLAQLQKSGNQKMAALGKAAAVFQTMIMTYQSATAAYAALAPIPVIGPALGAAAASAAIVAGLANVDKINSTQPGFKDGGYTGNYAADQIAGVVHGKEYVMDAGATARIGLANLQALQAGSATVQRPTAPSANGSTANGSTAVAAPQAPNVGVRIVNVRDRQEMLDYMKSSDGEQIILNVMQENAHLIAKG